MRPPKPSKRTHIKPQLTYEEQEIQLLDSWIDAHKPDSGTNPLAVPPPPARAAVGRLPGGGFSPYAGCKLFRQLPISKKTKEGLWPKYKTMSEIQRASLPHSLCGRDILGAAMTGSGKTLAFIIPAIEKLYRARWGREDGVGCIIISPTKELAGQIFEELKNVGRKHFLSAGLLIGGRKGVETEKEQVNTRNILVCTPGRLLQHMDETHYFDCSQLQVLVLDEADRILESGFKKEVDAIISQLPKHRQTMLFSATQTKNVDDLARLSLKDPEYISVHAESVTATPERLKQIATEVPLDQKLNMLWSFIKAHLNKKIIVFLTTCKQVKFVHEAFKKLRPGIPLICLHGRMKQNVRMAIYQEFCEKTSVLFSTDVASRGLDFPGVDWVVQVDCPEDVPTYIHRVGRTARFASDGKSILFLAPSEKEMIRKLQEAKPKIPIQLKKANTEKMQPVSEALSSLLVKYPNMKHLAERAFVTYLRSVKNCGNKEVFDVFKLPIEEYALSLGLPIVPKVRFIKQQEKGKKISNVKGRKATPIVVHQRELGEGAVEDDILFEKKSNVDAERPEASQILEKRFVKGKEDGKGAEDLKKAPKIKIKRLKINLHKPIGTRVKFDDDGNAVPPLATIADTKSGDGVLQADKVKERIKKLKEEMKKQDEEDKLLHRQRLRDRRLKEKMKMKRGREEGEAESEDDGSDISEVGKEFHKRRKVYYNSDDDEEADSEDDGSDISEVGKEFHKRRKVYYNSDDDEEVETTGKKQQGVASISVADQEALALKLLSSMHS